MNHFLRHNNTTAPFIVTQCSNSSLSGHYLLKKFNFLFLSTASMQFIVFYSILQQHHLFQPILQQAHSWSPNTSPVQFFVTEHSCSTISCHQVLLYNGAISTDSVLQQCYFLSFNITTEPFLVTQVYNGAVSFHLVLHQSHYLSLSTTTLLPFLVIHTTTAPFINQY
jgi:hypothetical protein